MKRTERRFQHPIVTAIAICFLIPVLLPLPVDGAETPASNLAMARRLEMLHSRIDPEINIYASRKRIEYFQEKLARAQTVGDKLYFQLKAATERLNAGESEQAARDFLSIEEFMSRNLPHLYEREIQRLRSYQAISHLRLGEQENCIEHYNGESCLLPIQGGGVHQLPRGSMAAIELYRKQLEQFPDDREAKWLLNIAHMTLGQYPEEVPEPWRLDPKLFESGHDILRFPNVASSLGVDVHDMAGGVVMDDFNGDGLLDLMVSAYQHPSQLRLFMNRTEGRFEETTGAAGLTGLTGGLNLIQADYDNDGDIDVLVLRGAWRYRDGRTPNSLLRNEGNGTFADVTRNAGLYAHRPTQTAVWFDFNLDGWLDLFIGNESAEGDRNPSELFLNNRDGTFSECARESGINLQEYVKGVVSGDYNNDGRPDLYVSILNGENRLYRNDGPAGQGDEGLVQFSEVGEAAGVQKPLSSFPCLFFDYDNDGWEDLYVASYDLNKHDGAVSEIMGLPNSTEKMKLYRNRGDGTFEDVTATMGLNQMHLVMGMNAGDLDNDGWLDLYLGTGNPDYRSLVPNKMFRNAGGEGFQDVTTSGGFGHLQKGHGVAFGDYDNDGDQDVYIVMGGAFTGDTYHNALFENPGHDNHWLKLTLEGTDSNRSAIGARIRVTVAAGEDRRTIHRTVGSGGSFGASSLRQHIGLGDAAEILAVEIDWPGGGTVQVYENLELNHAYRIQEGSDSPVAMELPIRNRPASAPPSHQQHSH